ncbi:MAG: RIP metalloprotease RseP [Candidatus Binatia bacterium]
MVTLAYAVVSAIVGLGVLVFIHEFGHFLVAKMSGVGVLTFSLGFGPKLLVKKVGETEYALSALPLGGYVKMVGEDPEEDVKAVDIAKSFSHQGLAKRIAIVAAGPLSNLLLAVAIFFWAFTVYGVPVLTNEVGGVKPNFPAARAGIEKGDLIVSVDGRPINNWQELAKRIQSSHGKALIFQVERDNRPIQITVQPMKKKGKSFFGEEIDIWVVGVTSSKAFFEKSSPSVAVGKAFYKTGEWSRITLIAIYKMIKGDVSRKSIGGPILIAQVAGQQAQEGLRSFLMLIAVLSINLGVLNLLPVPVLDGGHLLFFVIELLLGRPVKLQVRERAQQVGLFVLILVMVFASYNDISRFFE